MEVRIERHDHAVILTGAPQYCQVLRTSQTNLARVHRIDVRLSKECGHGPRNALVQKQLHRVLASWIILSSICAAAYAKAWRMSSSSSSGYSRFSSARSGYTASASITRRTVNRRSRMRGCPFIFRGSDVIRSNVIVLDSTV